MDTLLSELVPIIEEFLDGFRCDITLLELGRFEELHNRGIYLEGEF